jgi:hypothetical protein
VWLLRIVGCVEAMQQGRNAALEFLRADQSKTSWSCPHCRHAPFLNRGRFDAHLINMHGGAAPISVDDLAQPVAEAPAKRSRPSDDAEAREDDHGYVGGLEGLAAAYDDVRASKLVFGLRSVDVAVTSVMEQVAQAERWDDASRFVQNYNGFLDATAGLSAPQVERIVAAIQQGVRIPGVDELNSVREGASSIAVELRLMEGLSCVLIPLTLWYQRLLHPILSDLLVQIPQVVLKDGVRSYSSYVTAQHFEHICKETPGRFRICVALYSDATTVVHVGQRSMHPVYAQLMNGADTFPEVERRFLAGYIPVLDVGLLGQLGIRKGDYTRFRAQVFQCVIGAIARIGGMTVHDPNGLLVRRWGSDNVISVYPILCAYLGDRPELQMVAGRFVSHSDKLQQPCRRCSVHGCDLHLVDEEVEQPHNLDLDAAITAAFDLLAHPQHGTKSGINDFLTEHSVSLVQSGLVACKFWDAPVCTPRCSLHTAVLVIEGYILRWLPRLPTVDGRMLANLNARIATVDPGLGGDLYSLDKFKLSPRIKTAQHLHRAFLAASIAVREWLLPNPSRDRLVMVMCLWRRLYERWMAPTFTHDDMDVLCRLVTAFRLELPRVFVGLSASDFGFPTLHELVHIAQDRLLYGNDQVTSTQLLEHYHIEAVKEPFQHSNKTQYHVSLVLQMVRSYAQAVILRPITAPATAALAAPHNVGLLGRGVVLTLVEVIIERSNLLPHFQWRQLETAWSQLARLQHNVAAQCLTVFSQVWISSGSSVVASPSHYGRVRLDIIDIGDAVTPRFALALLLFSASAPQLPVLLGRSFVYCQLLVLPDPGGICPVYHLHRAVETDQYAIIPTGSIRAAWSPHRYALLFAAARAQLTIVTLSCDQDPNC